MSFWHFLLEGAAFLGWIFVDSSAALDIIDVVGDIFWFMAIFGLAFSFLQLSRGMSPEEAAQWRPWKSATVFGAVFAFWFALDMVCNEWWSVGLFVGIYLSRCALAALCLAVGGWLLRRRMRLGAIGAAQTPRRKEAIRRIGTAAVAGTVVLFGPLISVPIYLGLELYDGASAFYIYWGTVNCIVPFIFTAILMRPTAKGAAAKKTPPNGPKGGDILLVFPSAPK